VGDHLQRGPVECQPGGVGVVGHPRCGGGHAEDDVAHVVDAGVGDESLEVGLGQRDQRAVDDADHGGDGER
jgi:hypothetical protein